LGFMPGDLFIGISEGGETPFVIGATRHAKQLSTRQPYFLFCNPPEILAPLAKRSQEVLEDSAIHKICLYVGPMALSGSTRLQAATVLQLAVGLALFLPEKDFCLMADRQVEELLQVYLGLDARPLMEMIHEEGSIYKNLGHLNYISDDLLAGILLTDTTERSPTFGLPNFENFADASPLPAWCYLFIQNGDSALKAWQIVLGRAPRALEWPELCGRASKARMLGFHLGEEGRQSRLANLKNIHEWTFLQSEQGVLITTSQAQFLIPVRVDKDKASLSWDRKDEKVKSLPLLSFSLLLKMLMNRHSTLVMGGVGRYRSNIMTSVRPSNNKLVDRSIRYLDMLCQQQGLKYTYAELARVIFTVKKEATPDSLLVEESLKKLERRARDSN